MVMAEGGVKWNQEYQENSKEKNQRNDGKDKRIDNTDKTPLN